MRHAKKNFQLQMYNQPHNNNREDIINKNRIINKNPVAVKYSDNEVCSGGFVFKSSSGGIKFSNRIEIVRKTRVIGGGKIFRKSSQQQGSISLSKSFVFVSRGDDFSPPVAIEK